MMRAPLSPDVTYLSKAVSMGPGQTTLTLILARASSRARVLEKPITPALQAEYTASPVEPTRPASELIEMILPALRAIIWGMTAWQKLIGPFRLMAMTLSQVSGLLSMNGSILSQPALLTRMSICSQVSVTCCTQART